MKHKNTKILVVALALARPSSTHLEFFFNVSLSVFSNSVCGIYTGSRVKFSLRAQNVGNAVKLCQSVILTGLDSTVHSEVHSIAILIYFVV